MADTPIWKRLATDTDKSFEAFTLYRGMGANRSLEKVAEKLGKSGGLIERWSSEQRWKERVAAYDTWLDTINLEDTKNRQELIKNNAYSDYLLLRKAIDKYKTTLEDINFTGVPAYEIGNLVELMKKADDYARRAVGLPDKITESKTALSNADDKPFEVIFKHPEKPNASD